MAVGRDLSDPGRMPRFDAGAVEWMDRHYIELSRMTVVGYAASRHGVVQRHVARLGVRLQGGSEYYDRFMASCLAAELAYGRTFAARQEGRGTYDDVHPDAVPGPWRRSSSDPAYLIRDAATSPSNGRMSGHGLKDCLGRWKDNRIEARKPINKHLTDDMEATFAIFTRHSGLDDIGLVGRRHVIAFRDHIKRKEGYAAATLNKKIGYILSMSKVAAGAGWIEKDLGRDYYVETPADEDAREPYDGADLARIFAHPLFTEGWRGTSVKGLGEFQFWMPLISVCHGMITTEIGQLGPDTVGPHRDVPGLIVFDVTNAGGRTLKAYSRKRAIPIRRELLDLGLLDVFEAARKAGARTLWPEAERVGWPLASNYFSAFWTTFAANLGNGVSAVDKSLYSLRHAFQDAIESSEHHHLTRRLMGHASGGMTDRYGSKKQARAAPVRELDEAIQALQWPWLTGMRCGR